METHHVEDNGSQDATQSEQRQGINSAPEPHCEPLTDLGNAARLVFHHGQEIRYCPETNKWLYYQDGQWRSDVEAEIFRIAFDTINKIKLEAEQDSLPSRDKMDIIRHFRKSSSMSSIRSMINLARWSPEITIKSSELDSNPWFLNCQNGTLDLEAHELHPHRPQDLLTKSVRAPFDPEATCPGWEAFLSKIMAGDEEKINLLRRIVGYALTGFTVEQCLFIFHGSGANGKSTFVETIRELLGDYSMHTTTASLLSSKKSSIRNDLARLNSARFVSSVEVGMGNRLDESLIKQLTGGDQVTARYLYNEYFEFKPRFKLFICGNHMPEIRGVDHGIWRRIVLIPFEVTIPSEEIDKDLPYKLRQELPGILAWAAEGCREWQSRGLEVPESVILATSKYRSEMDAIRTFLDDRCVLDNTNRTPVGDLYEAYRTWTDEACQELLGKKTFGRLMVQKGYSQRKSGRVRYWSGVGLLH